MRKHDEIIIVISVFKKGTQDTHVKRVIGVTEEMIEAQTDVVKSFAHNTVDLAINEYIKNQKGE